MTAPLQEIEICPGDLSAMVAAAIAALMRIGGIYQRGSQLVRVTQLDTMLEKDGVRREAGSYLIHPITIDYLLLALARAAHWVKHDARSKAMRPADPPRNVASALLSAIGEWPFPVLRGLVSAPTLRPDGSLLETPGYDMASGLFGAFDSLEFPSIDPCPSHQDAMLALELLKDLFDECAFSGGKDSPHSTVPVAATMTAAIRHAIPMAPAFGISAHKQGSGKTILARAIGQLALGREPPVMALSESEAELRKCLLSILMAGDSCVIIDNVTRPVDSAALCAVLTSASYSDRVLGVNQRVTVPTASTWLLTGNHLEFVGDLTSRTLLSVLDPELERPEMRAFRRDLPRYVAEHRGELLAAALTISLAYFHAGSPAIDVPRSRFPEWDRFVRYPLIWLGCPDPLATQDDLRADDPAREALIAVLRALRQSFGNEAVTVARIIAATNGVGMSDRPLLTEAMQAVAGERDGSINNRRLGRYLARNVRSIEEGMRLEKAGIEPATNRLKFRVTSVSGVSSFQRAENVSADDENNGVTHTNAENAGNDGQAASSFWH